MKRVLTPEEQELWQRFTADVARTSHSAILLDDDAPTPLVQQPHPHPRDATNRPQTQDTHTPSSWVPESWLHPLQHPAAPTKASVAPSSLEKGATAGVDKQQARRFQRGKLGIDATLDLHGYNQQDAQHAFGEFIARAQLDGARVVCVITGHGKMRGSQGVLKASLPRWANLPENRVRILSYDQARPEHGGQGAYMLLLRKA